MTIALSQFNEVRLDRVSREFGALNALRDVSLTIQRREFIALLGPSGCGKSTTLNCIAGLLPVTGGAIWLDKNRIDTLRPEERGFGMVFQNYALFPHLNVRQNIGFGLKMRGVPKAEINRKVNEALSLVRLQGQENKLPGQLSGGQQQRVAIARAIVIEPPLVLMDEPLSNLDAKLRVEMRTEILRIQRELRGTIVHVTHDQEEAMTLAHRVVVMNEGRIEQIGTPAEVYRTPATEFVARFIGSPEMNVLDARDAVAALGLESPGAARVGVRPEDVEPAPASAGDDEAARFTARVEVVELLGAQAIVTLRAGAGQRLSALVASRLLEGLEEGAEATFVVRRGAVHRFDESGRRMPAPAPIA